MDALAKWLSWEGNFLKVSYFPDGIRPFASAPEWTAELSSPLGSYKGSHGATIGEAIADVAAELSKRDKSK
jgi:hypothetical protein